MYLQRLRKNSIVYLFHLLFMYTDTFCTLLIRQEESYAVYSPFLPCLGSNFSVRFHKSNSNGLLVYSEDSDTGRFFSVSLLPNRKLKIELELRVPQYRTTADHVILMLDCAQSEKRKGALPNSDETLGNWHLFTFSVATQLNPRNVINQIVVNLDGQEASYIFHPGIVYSTDNSSKLFPKFGDQLYVGQLPSVLRKDATQRALFSAAMQPTQLGRMQIFMHSTCVSNYHLHNHRLFNEKQCIQVKPKFLSHGAIWTQNFLNQGNQPLCCSQERKQSTKETGSYDVRGLMKDSCMHDHTKVINLNESSRARFTLRPNLEADEIAFQFRSRGFDQILYSSVLASSPDMSDTLIMQIHLVIYLANGSVHFVVENYSKNNFPLMEVVGQRRHIDCLSDYETCTDAQWHQVRQSVLKNSLAISVDNQPPLTYLLSYTTNSWSIQAVYLGHRPDTSDSKDFGSSLSVPRQQFHGCIRRLFLKIDGKKIPVLSMEKQDFIVVQLESSQILDECSRNTLSPSPAHRLPYTWPYRSAPEYISFVRPGGYVRIPGWQVVLSGEISFRFRTNEINGLLIYGSSVNQYEVVDYADLGLNAIPIPGGGKAGFDIFAMELRNGHLFCVLNTGSGSLQLGRTGVSKHLQSVTFLADGNEHKVKIQFNQGSIAVEVDGRHYMAHTADEKMKGNPHPTFGVDFVRLSEGSVQVPDYRKAKWNGNHTMTISCS